MRARILISKTTLSVLTLFFCISCSHSEPLDSLNASSGPGATGNMSEIEVQMFVAINAERTKQGLTPLVVNSKCVTAAQEHSHDMITRGFFGHDSPTETFMQRMTRQGLSGAWVGENIAGGSGVADVVDRWMNSAGHRANIVNTNFISTGIGYYQGDWTQCFTGYSGDGG